MRSNFSVFVYKVIKHLTSLPLNELVKLTMLCTTGPSSKRKILLLLDQFFSLSGLLFGRGLFVLGSKQENEKRCFPL